MSHSIAVLARSESFEQVWPQLAQVSGASLVVGEAADDLGVISQHACVIVSVAGSEHEGLPLLRSIRRETAPPTCIVAVNEDRKIITTCVREGAERYFVLPADLTDLRDWVRECVAEFRRHENAAKIIDELRQTYNLSHLLGQSPPFIKTLESASKVMQRGNTTVLLTGETGTGKDVLARAIHYNGPRSAKPFVEVNCTALPEHLLEAELFGYEAGAFTDARVPKPGLFETADGGTLFLDEIGDLSASLQAKLLRVLEDKWIRRLGSVQKRLVDVRIIAATNVDLPRAVQNNSFRRDLHYRLNVFPIHLPPLRERGEDILLLANKYAREFAEEYGFQSTVIGSQVARVLLLHSWPGNVRELRNTIERAMLLGDGILKREHLFPDLAETPPSRTPIPFPASLEAVAREVAKATVTWFGGNKSQAAATLEISRKRLYTLLNGAKVTSHGST